jgi:hypothetical protein
VRIASHSLIRVVGMVVNRSALEFVRMGSCIAFMMGSLVSLLAIVVMSRVLVSSMGIPSV